MTLNRGAQSAMIATFFAVVAAVYAVSWFTPAIGLDYDDAVNLVTSRAIAGGHGYAIESLPQPVPQTGYPPLLPALLALFTLVSQQTQWLKLLPLLCTMGWLVLTRQLLLKMGASRNAAVLLAGLAAASPTVIFLGTNLLAEPLFALLATAALLALLEERALLAGVFAGLATLTLTPGVALIAACILTLVVRGRFRKALTFAGVAMVMVAPWFGWSLANAAREAARAGGSHAASNILTGLAASEKLVVLGSNTLALIASPVSLLTGYTNTFTISATILIVIWCLILRRQLVPDLFVAFYCLLLLGRTWPPQRAVAPILPLLLWMLWRVVRLIPVKEALAALVLLTTGVTLWAAISRVPSARASGFYAVAGESPDDWGQMRLLHDFIRANTAAGDVVLADLDPVVYLNTGRKAVRGFTPDGFDLFYAPRQSRITPDRLSQAMLRGRVNYVVVMPDRGFPASAAFHRSVEALERGGVLEPVTIPGIGREYRLLRVTR